MANEMFTNRYGKQVPVLEFRIPADKMLSIMRLQEDYIKRGEHLSLLGVVLDVIDKGVRTVQYHWKAGEVNKNRRDFAKNVAAYVMDPAKYAKEIESLAIKHGLVKGMQVELSAPTESEVPTDEQLEEMTAPETTAV